MSQKRKPNIVLGNYWREEEHFADLYNAVLFHGRTVILPEDLAELDTESSNILEHGKYVQNIIAVRDVVKVVKYSKKHGVQLAILGIENQDKIHYAMPLRVMEYDAYTYKKQYQQNAKKYLTERGMTEEEFLSRMKRTDKFIPVITIVIYYGEKEWDGAKCLKDMLAISDEVDNYVNDYQMNLVEVRKGSLSFHNQQNRDLFEICGIFYNQSCGLEERKRMVIEYTKENSVDNSVITTAGAVVGKELRIEKKEGMDMCSFFEELEKQCEERGEKRGEKRGEMLKLISMVCKKLKKGNTTEEIAEILEERLEDIQAINIAAKAFAPEYDVEKIYLAM